MEICRSSDLAAVGCSQLSSVKGELLAGRDRLVEDSRQCAQVEEAAAARTAAELAEVSLKPRISGMARSLRHAAKDGGNAGGGSSSWSRLTRTRTDKTQVKRGIGVVCHGLNGPTHNSLCSL